MNFNENIIALHSLESLDSKALLETFGGKPSADTSFGYDIAYYATKLLLLIGEGASAIKG